MKKDRLSKKKMTVIQWSISVVMCLIICCSVFYLKIGKILIPLKKSNFENVRIVVTMKSAIINIGSDTLEKSNKEGTESDNSYEARSEGNSENSIFSDGLSFSKEEEYGRMTVNNGIIYSESNFGKRYFYEHDDEKYIAFFIKNDLFNETDGKWYGVKEETTGEKPIVDLETIYELSPFKFKKSGNANEYILREDLFEVADSLFGIGENAVCEELVFRFEKNRLDKIRLEYISSDKTYFIYNFSFDYDQHTLTLPENINYGG